MNPVSPRHAVPARSLTVGEVAALVDGRVEGDPATPVTDLLPVFEAGPGEMGLLSHRRYLPHLEGTRSGSLLVGEALVSNLPHDLPPRVIVAQPREAMVRLLAELHPEPRPTPSIHPTAVLGRRVVLGKEVHLSPYAVIEDDVVIGDGVRIGAHCVVGSGSSIGPGSLLHPHVVLYPGSVLGARAILHAGARVGVDGFGYASGPDGHRKLPHVGGCLLEDDVEIGANTCLDRGSIGTTRIGEGTKLDNLVHLGHNVQVGRRGLIMAQVGIAGSTTIGEGAVLAGQAGAAGHLTIGAGATLTGRAGVIGDVPPGAVVSGYPARNHRDFLRAMGRLFKLPELQDRVEALERSSVGRGDD